VKRSLKNNLSEFNRRARLYLLHKLNHTADYVSNQIWVKDRNYSERSLGYKTLNGQRVQCWEVSDRHGTKHFRVSDDLLFGVS
jgi:hypothetical protein